MDLKADGTWTKPVNAGETINSASDEDYAFVENDEILYFSSNRAGVYNLYLSKAEGATWAEASVMPEPYNSAANDYNMLVVEGTPYLISERNVGNGSDIYAFVKRPCQVSVGGIQVIQEFTGTAYAIKGEVSFVDAPITGELKITDATGVSKTFSMPQTSPISFEMDNIDCDEKALERNVTVSFTADECEAQASYQAPAEIKKEFYWVDFMFEFDKAELTEQSKADMERLAVEMRKFPDAKYEIAGYADARGSDAYNDRLSERRAKAVKEATGAAICIHPKDACGLSSAGFSLADAIRAKQGALTPDYTFTADSQIKLGDTVLQVMETPGHTVGSVCFIGDGCIFTGDTLFRLGAGRTDLATGNYSQLLGSLKRLYQLSGDYKIYPGHGKASTLDVERTMNPFMIEANKA
jgi:hypothetical protein